MGRDWKKRMSCILLAVTLTVSNVQPVFATTVEDDSTNLCDHHMVHENCGYVEGEENSCTYSCELCIAEEKAIADQAAADAVSVQIAALPTVEAVKEMTPEAQSAAYEQTQAVYAAYSELTEEQKALLPSAEEVFKPLFDYFNSLTAEAMDVTDSFAVAGSCGDLTWELDEEGTLTISGEGAIPDYFVQESQNAPWYAYRTNIKEVIIGQLVTDIGDDAFAGCENMTAVTIADGVTKIGCRAFDSCGNLSAITIPGSVTSIGDHAFFGCKLLQEVAIPDSVKELGVWVFSGCSSLTSVALPDNLGSIPSGTFHECSSLQEITIPGTVSFICDSAFSGCSSLKEITLPQTTTLEYQCFYGCSGLTMITIPASVIEIGAQAFSGCTGVTEIKFEGDAPVFGENEGNKAQFESVTATVYYPAGNATWTEAVRQNYGGTVTWTAENSGETGTVEPGGTLLGGTSGNVNWELENGVLTISGISSMPNYSGPRVTPWYEYREQITQIVLEDGVKTVGECAFGDSSVGMVMIPDSVTRIESHAFEGCAKIEELIIPDSVTIIELSAFKDCTGLKRITFEGNAPERDSLGGCFTDNVTATAYYPAGNDTWTEDIRQSYGGTITWVTYNPDGSQSNYIFYPENGATEVGSVSASGEKVGIDKLTITFDKKIKKNSDNDSRALLDFSAGTIAIYRKDDDTLVWKAEEDPFTPGTAGTEVCVDSAQTTLVIEPVNRNNMFDFDTEYYVVVDAGVIIFEDNTKSEAITEGNWKFTTIPELPFEKTCTLGELTSVDYLALADLCYSPAPSPEQFGIITVQEIVQEMIGEDQWESTWSTTDIKISKLFSNVADWVVYDVSENTSTGFAAYAFKNDYDEFVIAYRGSEKLEEWFDWPGSNWWDDWIENNAKMFLGGNGSQISEALQFAQDIINKYGPTAVKVTGHSLGGVLCDIVSARYSCAGESFNAAQFLANAYYYYPEKMGELFTGVNNWPFVDHITQGDSRVGEAYLEYKNYIIHKNSNYSGGTHGLESLIVKSGDDLFLTAVIENASEKSKTVSASSFTPAHMILCTTDDERVLEANSIKNIYVCEGNGSGNVSTGIGDDTLIGGLDEDILDGGYFNDNYYYFKGHGEDWIFDLSGHDTLTLLGYNETDEMSVEASGVFVDVLVNGEVIVHIAQKRAKVLPNSFKIIKRNGTSSVPTDISEWLKSEVVRDRVVIACPVSIEIIDDITGNVVHTMVNGESGVGAAYTDYGYFYVYQDESGEYVKVADLFEGYSLHIVGENDGTMDVSVYEVTEDGLAEPVSLTDVPVTDKLSATIEKKNDGKLYLMVDSDSDDETDKEIPFDGGSGDDNTPGGDTSEDETPNDEAEDIDDILAQLSGMTAQNVVPGDKTKILSILGSIEVLLAEEELTDDQRQLLTGAKETGEMLLDAIAALETAAKNVSDQITGLPAAVEPDDEAAVAKIMATKDAYDGLVSRAKALISAEQKAKLDALVKAATDYKIIKGNNGKWWKNSERTLSFTVNAPFNKFESIEIDGKTIAESNYTAKSGSTIITLKSSFLQTLSTGEHTITVEFTDNEASGSFTVQMATSIPFTGDTFHLTLWISVMVVAGASLVALLYRKRRQK